MLGTFIFNSSEHNQPKNKTRISTKKSKNKIRNSENQDENIPNSIPISQEKQKIKKETSVTNLNKPAIISSSSFKSDSLPSYASGIANSTSVSSSFQPQPTQNKIIAINLNSNLNSDSSIESICVENAKLKTQLEEMEEKESSMRLLAEENDKLRKAHIKLNVELEKLKASKTNNNPSMPNYQNLLINYQQVQELKEDNKNKAEMIEQLNKQQILLSNENEELKQKVLKRKERFKELASTTNELISENERLRKIIQEERQKSTQTKEEIQILKVERKEPVLDRQVLQSLNNQVEVLEKSFGDLLNKNDRLSKENSQLKEQISLYQQIDSKMQIENEQLRNSLMELMKNPHEQLDKSLYIPKDEFDKTNQALNEYKQQIESFQNIINKQQRQISSKELHFQELNKEKDILIEKLRMSQKQIDEIKIDKDKLESEYNSSLGKVDNLNQKINEYEQILYENSQLREKNLSLSKKISEFASSEKLELENNNLKQENNKLKESLEQASQISEIKDMVYENDYGYGKDESILVNENKELKSELEDTRNRLNSIMDVLKECSIENLIP